MFRIEECLEKEREWHTHRRRHANAGLVRRRVHLGKEIYERDILPQIEADHFGEYVAIDVETGGWAVADTTRVAVERLRAQHPDAVDVLCERVGYRALRSFGAGSQRRTEVIEGAVNPAYEAVVALLLQGPDGRTRDIEAVVDTGYSGFLTLPTALVAELGLPFAYMGQAFLANDAEVDFDVHYVTVLWDDQPRDVEADATGSTPLVGMLLLDMHDLSIQVRNGGRVLIEAMA